MFIAIFHFLAFPYSSGKWFLNLGLPLRYWPTRTFVSPAPPPSSTGVVPVMLVLASPQALPLDDSNPSDNGFEGLVLDQHFLLTKLMQGKPLVAMGPTSLLHVRTLVATASAILRRHMHDHGHEWHEALHHSWYSHTAHPGVIRSDSEAFGCTACF